MAILPWAYFAVRVVGNPFLPVFAAFIVAAKMEASRKDERLRSLFMEYGGRNSVRIGVPGTLLLALLINVPVEIAIWGITSALRGPIGFEAFLAWRAAPMQHIPQFAAVPLLALPMAVRVDANLIGLFYLPLFLLSGLISLGLTICQIRHFGAPIL